MELTKMGWILAGVGFTLGIIIALLICGIGSYALIPVGMVFSCGLGTGGVFLAKMLEG